MDGSLPGGRGRARKTTIETTEKTIVMSTSTSQPGSLGSLPAGYSKAGATDMYTHMLFHTQ